MLEVRSLVKHYGDVVALDDVSLTVARGQLLGFLGPNGAGKTTTMRAILGLISLDGGEVRWDGAPITADVRRRVGYMPAERGMYPKMRVREHVVYFARLTGLDRADAERAADRWMERLDLSGRGDTEVQALSSGNQQRVQLALALVNDPDLLVLDEPFAGLDPIATDVLKDIILERVDAGAALLFSSHQLDLVEEVSAEVVIIDRGHVVLAGDVGDLRRSSPHRYVDVTFVDDVAWEPPVGRIVVKEPRHLVVQVDPDVDLPRVLADAEGRGPLASFSFEPPELSEVFLAAVGRSVVETELGAVTTGASIALIAQREVRQRLRSRAFLVFTVLIAVVILGIGVLHRVLSDTGPSTRTVAVVGTAPPQLPVAVGAAGQTLDLRIRLVGEPDEATARAALDAGQVDAVIVASSDGSLLFRSSIDTDLQRAVDAAWQSASVAQAASSLGLTAEQTAALVSPPALRAVTVEPKDDNGPGMLVGFVTAVLLLVSVTTFGGYVLSGVVEEKTSAIIELLLSHVRAYQLLAGKVLGIGAVALVQMAVAVAAGAVALGISGASIPVEIWVAVPTTLLWFVAGFVLYSTLFALAGSFVSRQEDAQAAAAPISLTFMAAYFIVFTVGTDPGSTTATVLSLLPPFAPLLMPLRIATASAAWWEIVVSAVLLLVAIAVVLRVAGAIYARTPLHRGSRITWRQALRFRAG